MSKIVFAGGCFWGVQHYFNLVKGVSKTQVGYIGGIIPNPVYELVKKGVTGHTEACLVEYDNNQTNLIKLLVHFFFIIDPTMLNRQAHDIGTQYRTAIYFYNDHEKDLINNFIISHIKPKYNKPVVVEVNNANQHPFWPAEEYHQDYLKKNPSGYCHLSKDTYNRCRDIDVNNNI